MKEEIKRIEAQTKAIENIRREIHDLDKMYPLDTPDKIPTFQDVRGILKPDLVEAVAKWLHRNFRNDPDLLTVCTYDERWNEIYPCALTDSYIKRAHELIALLPLDEIRELAKGIDKRIYDNGWMSQGNKLGWDLGKIIALCPEPADKQTVRDEIADILEACLDAHVGHAKGDTDIEVSLEQITAIIDRERDE